MPFFLSELLKKARQPTEEDIYTDYLLHLWKQTYDSISHQYDFNNCKMSSHEVYQLEVSSISDYCVAFSAVSFCSPPDYVESYLKRTFRGSAYKYLSTNISESQYLDYRNKKFRRYHQLNSNDELTPNIAHSFICDFIEVATGKPISEQIVADVMGIDSFIAQYVNYFPIFISNYGLNSIRLSPDVIQRRRTEYGETDIERWSNFVNGDWKQD